MDAWDRLLTATRGTFSERDLVALYWDTLRSLCDHYRITSPVDVAFIELRWKALQPNNSNSAPSSPRHLLGPASRTSSHSTLLSAGSFAKNAPPPPPPPPPPLPLSPPKHSSPPSMSRHSSGAGSRQSMLNNHVDPAAVNDNNNNDIENGIPHQHQFVATKGNVTVNLLPRHDSNNGRNNNNNKNKTNGVIRVPVKTGDGGDKPRPRSISGNGHSRAAPEMISPRREANYNYTDTHHHHPSTSSYSSSNNYARLSHIAPRVDTNLRGSGAHEFKLRTPMEREHATPPDDLRRVFELFSSFGGGDTMELDSARCVKLCRDCGVTSKVLLSHDVEILFAKARRRGERRLTYRDFRQGLVPDIAKRLGVPVLEIVKMCQSCPGPTVQATRAENVRLHDDAVAQPQQMRRRSASASNRRTYA